MESLTQPSAPSPNFLQEVGNVAETVGIYYVYFLTVVAVISVVLIALLGVLSLLASGSRKMLTQGTVTSTKCNGICMYEVTYQVDGNQLKAKVRNFAPPKKLEVGDSIPLYYNSKNPQDVTAMSPQDFRNIGYGLLGLAALIAVIAAVRYFLTTRFKIFAQLEGILLPFSI